MRVHGRLLFVVLVVLIGSSKTEGQGSALTSVFTTESSPNHADTTALPDIVDTKWTLSGVETSSQNTEGTVYWETTTVSVLGPYHMNTNPSEATSQQTSSMDDMSTESNDAFSDSKNRFSANSSAFSSQASESANKGQDSTTPSYTVKLTSSKGHTLTPQLQSQSQGPDQPPAKAETSDPEVPAELAVGDDDVKARSHHSSSPLDALLAGLLSVFIVTTAVVFLVLFLRFRQKTNQPEFHRLHDLPMDDLMEDTPLSRYSY